MASNKEHSQYYPYFDWLRGSLAITVMLGHEGLIAWSHAGNCAVQIFFALSGWLIGNILINTLPKDLPRFYFNRAIRIWVPYFIALSLVLAASLLREPITAKWLEFVFYKISFVYNIFGPPQLAQFAHAMPLAGSANHFWSVNAEEQFYLLAPLLLVLVRPAFARHAITWVGIAVLAWATDTYASIVFGVLASVAVNQFGNFHQNMASKLLFLFILIASIIGFSLQINYEMIVPFAAIAIVMLLAQTGKKNNFGAIIGGMSYPLYLNHWIGLFIAHAALKPFGLRDSALAHIISFILNVGLAISLYWFIDRRLLASRGQWFTQKRGLIATYIAYGMVIIGCVVGFVITQ
jgi:peptidoglycan/LPS O-acetylase OafA/YrhL